MPASTEEHPSSSRPEADAANTDRSLDVGVAAFEKVENEDDFPSFRRALLIMPAVYLSLFIVGLDQTIVATAVPRITDDFHSLDDVGWYASAYLLTSCAFQLIYGRIYTFYAVKWVMLAAVTLFETGSAICGAAPNSTAFIFGRAVAGLGCAGIFSGCINVMVITIPLHKRPIYQGIFGACFGLSLAVGPLIGGALTTDVSWRWCFYINLPVGGMVIAVILLFLPVKSQANTESFRQQITKLDPWGTLVFLPGVVCLLLALQWGGTTYPWSSWRIILLFVLSAILLAIFVWIQFRQGDNATIPIRIIKQRSVASGVYFSLVQPGSVTVGIYYLPLWFQAIKGVTAIKSGIDTLPLVLSLIASSICAGTLTQVTGYYTSQLLACSVVMSAGAGLLTTLKVDTDSAKWIGFQVLYGFGMGLGMQQAGLAAQTCLDKKDVPTGVALMFFMQSLGGSIFISIGEVVFENSLVSKLSGIANLDASAIINAGATELRNVVPSQYLKAALVAYDASLSNVFKLAVACASATILAGLTMEWRSVKGLKHGSASSKVKGGKAEEDMSGGTGTKSADSPSGSAV